MARIVGALLNQITEEDLDYNKAIKYFTDKKHILERHFERDEEHTKALDVWFDRIFSYETRGSEHLKKCQAVKKKNNDLGMKLLRIWKFFYTHTVIGLVKISKENTAEFAQEPFVPRWFQVVLANEYEIAYYNWKNGKKPAFISCSIPPQHAKSTIIGGGFVPLILGNTPYSRVVLATYSSDMAKTMMDRDILATIRNPYFSKVFGKTFNTHFTQADKKQMTNKNIRKPKESALEASTIQGGRVKAGSLRNITGSTADCLLIDDPIKDMTDALSEAEMEKVRTNYVASALTRINPNSLVALVHTRWVENDIIGFTENLLGNKDKIEKAGLSHLPPYTHICFRAYYDPTDQFPYDFRKHKDQKLWPSNDFKYYVISEGSNTVAQALLQQRPLDLKGKLIQKDWIQQYEPYQAPLEYSKIVISVDTSFNDNKGSDKVAIGVFGVTSRGKYYLIDLVYDRMTFTDTIENLIEVTEKYPDYYALLVEDKSNGAAVIDVLNKKISRVKPVNPTDSKKARVHAVIPVLENKKLHVPDDKNGAMFIQQLCTFSGEGNKEKDDLVDITTQCISYVDEMFRTYGAIDDMIATKSENARLKEEGLGSLNGVFGKKAKSSAMTSYSSKFKGISSL